MSDNLPKYLIFGADDIDKLNKFINKRADAGYKLQDIKPYQGIGGTVFIVTMYQPSTPDIQNAANFVIIEFDKNTEDGTPLLEKMLAKGWVPASEAYAKHIVLMKKREEKLVPSEKETEPCPGDCDVCYARFCNERRSSPKEGC